VGEYRGMLYCGESQIAVITGTSAFLRAITSPNGNQRRISQCPKTRVRVFVSKNSSSRFRVTLCGSQN
jgi:hypothetical protein